VVNNIFLSIIIPSYLEEENLRILLPRLKQTIDNTGYTYEVLVIDTMMPLDRTKSVCEEFGFTYEPRVGGNNYGDAVRTGILRAKGKNIIFMDADGSHTPEFCLKLLEHVDKFDIVIASRYIDGGSTDNGKLQIIMSKIVNIMYSKILGLKCKDVSNSFKMYRRSSLEGIELKSSNFDIIEELLYKIKKKRGQLLFFEIPYSFKARMFGHTKRNLIAFVFSYIITILKLRFGK